ncbi:hypothetical protein BDY19DRAFT_886416 [Irpex rosettiformis]|uniref:Uncharacterized protein n=1 Tax=Irpex rosettiformis TaxID=378272 RepID=A0ACB8U9Y7_9APHY|nr:hypothetical protein BDY19DRAFT_886416 [Irpex rosettiformis]
MLATLHEWSIDHISHVFEAKSEDECLQALDDTFSPHIEFMSNGKQLSPLDLHKFVLSMVITSGFRLKVQWQNALEVPRDASNRDGVLGGYYIITNVRKTSPSGTPVPGRFARHKFVNVVIESESDDDTVDSRRIVRLNLTATDKPQ